MSEGRDSEGVGEKDLAERRARRSVGQVEEAQDWNQIAGRIGIMMLMFLAVAFLIYNFYVVPNQKRIAEANERAEAARHYIRPEGETLEEEQHERDMERLEDAIKESKK